MSDPRTSALQYAQAHRTQFLEELKSFGSIASISTDPTAKPAIQQAAEWVATQMRDLGMQKVQVYPTAGHPVVYGEKIIPGAKVPTILFYGHYDVQPVDPIELWTSPPFEPTIRGDNIYARGISDMKGQVLVCFKAIESIERTSHLPVNVKFLIEGEEEIGSPHLSAFIQENKDLLACDFAVNPDSGILGPETPTITYALRGLVYFELRVFGPDHDLHSGIFGGTVHNPAQALSELVAGMHDQKGRVTLPGFYARVRPLGEAERSQLALLPNNEAFYLNNTGAPALWGDPDYTPVERVSARPTLEINGLLSGFTGEGTKTVLPAWAMAKISCRLVPDQDPDEIYQSLRDYLEAHAPASVRWTLTKFPGSSPAAMSNLDSPGVKAVSQAMQSVWGKPPLFKREGGSVPVVSQIQTILGVDTVNTGFVLPDDNLHSPNEKMHLPTWYRGIDTFIHFFFNL